MNNEDMTDRELLEKAASAAGIRLDWDPERVCSNHIEGTSREWNPLTDDGDAFRLAAKLEIDVCFFPGFMEVRAEAASVHAMGHAIEDYADDMAAVTRRAIVRAAAAITASPDR